MRIIFSLLVLSALASAAVVNRQCAYGPGYWCGTITQAKECGAVQYCMDNVWTQIESKASPFCSDCEAGIAALRAELEKTSVDKEIEQVIEKFCNDLGSLSDECKMLVKAYGPEVLKALIQEMQPTQVCTLMGFCSRVSKEPTATQKIHMQLFQALITKGQQRVLKTLIAQIPKDAKDCGDCKVFIADVKKLLNNATVENMIVQEVMKICDIAGEYENECKLILSTIIPQGIGQLVERIIPATICADINFCPGGDEDVPVAEPPVHDPCQDCEAFMGDISKLLQNGTVQNMILKDLEGVCMDLGSLSAECTSLVEQYGQLVINLIVIEFKPSTVCNLIGFCNGEAKHFAEMVKSVLSKVNVGDMCSDCTAFFGDVSKMLSNVSVQQQILKEIGMLCNDLGSLGPQCQQYVSQYGPLVLNLLISELNPKTICGDIGFCMAEEAPEAEVGDLCGDCELLVKEADQLLNNVTIQNMFLKDLTTICKYFGTFQAECKTYIMEYGNEVFEIITALLDPKTICTDIGFCPGEKKIIKLPKLPFKLMRTVPNDMCSDCTAFLKDISTILNNVTIQQQILQEIEMVCNDLGSLGPQCKEYVSQYGPLVVNLLLQYLDPNTICSDIGFCMDDAPMPVVRVGLTADICTDCKNFIGDVAKILNNVTVQQQILQEIEMVCNDLGSLGPQCKEYVSQYGPLVINFLLQYLDPTAICGDIGFCSANKVDYVRTFIVKSIVGADMCTDCKNFIGDVSKILNNVTVQQKILQEIEMVCNDLGSLGPQCQQYVSQYGPLVINFLLQYLDPTATCGDIGFCSGSAIKMLTKFLIKTSLPSAPNDICSDCKMAIKDIDAIFTDPATQKMFLKDLTIVCKYFGSFQDQCTLYIQEYGPLVLQLLSQYIDPTTICDDFGFCSSKTSLLPVLPLMKNSVGDMCSDCTAFVGDVTKILNNVTVQQQILQEIEMVCNDLGSLGPQCKEYVSQYGPLVINLLLQYLNPKAFCSDIGFCTASQQTLPLKTSLGDDCSDCKAFIGDVSKILNNVTVQQQILQEIEMLCNDLGSLGPQCQEYVSQYGPLVINFLLQYIDPNTICKDIDFCPGESSGMLKRLVTVYLKTTLGDDCSDCKAFIGDVSKILNNVTVQQQILQEIEKLCNDLGSLGPQCQQYVSQYGPLVINFILQYIDPNTICKDIDFCPGESSGLLKTSLGDDCSDCKAFIGDVSKMLNNVTVQQQILQEIEMLCNDLGSLGPQCQEYVSQYGPLVINFLLQYIDPNTICKDIDFCPGESSGMLNRFMTVYLKKSLGDDCSDCKAFIKDVSMILNNVTVQQQILQEIEMVCNDLGSLGPQCQEYVSQYGPLVINFLLQYLDPTTICTDIDFCMGDAIGLFKRFFVIAFKAKLGDECSDCMAFFKDVDTMLGNVTLQNMLLNELEKVCMDLGSFSTQCQQYVSEYGPLVLNLLTSYLTPTMACNAIGFCSSRPVSTALALPMVDLFPTKQNAKVSASAGCAICEYVLHELDVILDDEATEEEITAAMSLVCSILPASVATECSAFIKEYGPMVLQLLANEIDPKQVCTIIKLCSAPKLEVAVVKQGEQCAICEFVLNELEKILGEHSTEEEIRNALDTVCSLLPSSVATECSNLVDTYTDQIIQLILAEMSPSEICTILKLCTSTKEPVADVAQSQICVICEFALKELDKFITKDSTEAEIEALLGNICTLLPSTLTAECEDFVKTYTSEIVVLIIQDISPSFVCRSLGVCAAEEPKLEITLVKVEASGTCVLCEFVMKEVDKYISQDSTEAEIKAVLQNICSLVPSSLKAECQDFITQYTSEIIMLLVQKLSPSYVCRGLGVCSTREEVQQTSADVDANTPCVVCEFAMKELDKFITKDSTEQEIEQLLDKICTLLPSSISAECTDFIDTYASEIIALIVQNVSPSLVCRFIGLCGSDMIIDIQADTECVICEFAMKELDKFITKDTTEQQIEALLENICNLLPSTLLAQCDDFVKTYTSEIVVLIIQNVSPRTVCRLILLCDASNKLKFVPNAVKVEALPQCIVCEFALGELEKFVTKESTEVRTKCHTYSVTHYEDKLCVVRSSGRC